MMATPIVFASDSSTQRNLRQTNRGLMVWAIGSASLIVLYASAFASEGMGTVVSIFSHGILIGAAFASVGILVGFLFGIPRTLQSDSVAPATGTAAPKSSGQDNNYRQTVNTNLEQISDWLTKILVGVGLTQLQTLPKKLMGMATYFQGGLHGNAPVTLVVILNSMVFGFFMGYLLTRLFLASAFSVADRAAETLLGAEQFAQGLTEAKQYRQAISTLETALSQIGPDTPIDVERKIYESLTYNYLYEEAPDGFQRAIKYGLAYTQKHPDAPSARVWAYLAAAYGQQYKWEVEHDHRDEVLKAVEQSAVDAITKSLALEPKMKTVLRSMWDPKDPTKEPTQEDDLEVFYPKEPFQTLLA